MKRSWYVLKGSDPTHIEKAITMARVIGSVGSTYEEVDSNGSILKSATVIVEGHQDNNYYFYKKV